MRFLNRDRATPDCADGRARIASLPPQSCNNLPLEAHEQKNKRLCIATCLRRARKSIRQERLFLGGRPPHRAGTRELHGRRVLPRKQASLATRHRTRIKCTDRC